MFGNKIKVAALQKMLDDEVASIQDIIDNSASYYTKRGKTDYDLSVEAAYLYGRIDALRSIQRHITEKTE